MKEELQNDTKPDNRVRRQFVKDCKRCKEIKFIGGFGPHHDPSRGCKSGGREHCSCPICWG
jgi:hypothetical protein